MEVMIEAQGQIDHLHGFGNGLGPAAEAREKMADVAVVLLDREGQVFAGDEMVFRDETVKAVPVVGEEGLAREADFIEELLTGGVITATKHPGDGAASDRVICSPNPEFLSLFLRKCHISSSGDNNSLGRHRRFGQPAGFITNPLEDRDIADPENARDAAKAHIAHCVKHQRQSLHGRRLAARRRVREIAAAGLALVALQISNRSPLDVIRPVTALADNLAHGSLCLRRTMPFYTRSLTCIYS